MPVKSVPVSTNVPETICLENDRIRALIAPSVGGRVVSLVHKASGHEYLWRNTRVPLRLEQPGAAYDPNFFGGIDELIPNDPPELLAGADCPDHGELWTTPLRARRRDDSLELSAILPRCGLQYNRTLSLSGNSLRCDYTIANPSPRRVPFMWKLHAALAIAPGDRVECPAQRARPLGPDWTRCDSMEPFAWPRRGALDMSVVPARDNTLEFLCLESLREGRMSWERPRTGHRFTCEFDRAVFPWCWYFGSYGKFDGHYVAILEPCTCRGMSVAEADTRGECSSLESSQTLSTTVTIRMEGPGDI